MDVSITSIGRAFSSRICGAAVHGAAPHAGIGRAVGAGLVEMRANGALQRDGLRRAFGAVMDEWAESAEGAGYTSLGRSPRKLTAERTDG